MTPLLARVNPLAPLVVLTTISIAVFFVFDPLTLLQLHGAVLIGVLWAGRLGVRRLLRVQLRFLPFAAGVFAVNAVSRPGSVLTRIGPLAVTDAGMQFGTALALRVLAIATLAAAIALRTDPTRLVTALIQHARLSPRFGFAVLTGHRMLAALPQEWRLLLAAGRMRAPLRRSGRPRIGVRGILRAAFGLLTMTIRRGTRVADSLEARGLGAGPRTFRRPAPITGVDWTFVVVSCALCAALLLRPLWWPF